jgi:hypothetical protein
MRSLTVSEEMFERLTRRAAALHVTIEQLIAALLDLVAESDNKGQFTPSATATPFDNWKRRFEAWMAQVQTRAHRYPPGFVMDDSRESIYQGCGE